MKPASVGIARALRVGGVLLALGLGVDIVSLIWEKPLAFLLFAGMGCSLTLIGILVYLYSLVALGSNPDAGRTPAEPPSLKRS
jgi:hypothetical protein